LGILLITGYIASSFASQSQTITSGTNGDMSTSSLSSPAKTMIKITNPFNGESVPATVKVSGTILGDLPSNRHMWILVNPELTPGVYWPQRGYEVVPFNGLWSWIADLGGNSGENLSILAVLVDDAANQQFIKWNEQCVAADKWPGLGLPDGAEIMDRVTVIKQ
jgi:hypothetical protein